MIKAYLYAPMVGEVNPDVPVSTILERIEKGLGEVYELAEFETKMSINCLSAHGLFLRFLDLDIMNVSQIKPEPITIGFGANIERLLNESTNGKLTEDEMDENYLDIKTFEFETVAEKLAFQKGIEAMDGYTTYSYLL